MKIDPVWVVQPRADRRAFLLAGGAFVLGGFGGYGLRVLHEPGAAAPPKNEKTGDPELDELRRLAVEAPIEELSAQWSSFVTLRDRKYQQDGVLVEGLRRLVNQCVVSTSTADRRLRAKMLARSVRLGAAMRDGNLAARLPQLEEIAR